MLTLRAQIIFLLVFIGSHRAPANPTTVTYPLEPQPEELNNASSTLDEKKKHLPEQNWDCQADSDYIQEQISLTTKLLSDGEKVTQKQKDQATDETILVLGKAGSGKTSLVQFLTQNPKLQSKKIRSDTGEYIIEDGEKIGISATESFTLYPELVNFNSSITFCDSPGFHDSRSSAHEIVSMDVMKSVTSRFKKVKILLLEKYSSLQYGFSKDSFINTLRHLNDFLVDIDRYKDHIVLIATKIPFSYKMPDNDESATPELITEDMYIESIMEYLNHTESAIAEKLQQKTGKSMQKFYQNVIKLLQSLQTRDENGKATRVNVFRRPYRAGSLKSMPLLEKNKEFIAKTIENLDFVAVEKNDFDFTLSDTAKMYLECLLKLISDNYKSKINGLSYKLSGFVSQKTQNYTSFHQVLSDLDKFHNSLKQLSEKLDETNNYNDFFDQVNSFISDQKLSSHINYNEQIHVLEKYEEMLMKFMDTNLLFTPTSWTLPIRQVIKSAEDELLWYKSLNKFIVELGSYKVQKNKTEIYPTIFHERSTSTNDLINLFVGITGNTNLKQLMEAQGDTKRRLELVSITKTLLQQSNITCDASGRLIVKGFQISISEINLEDLVRLHCNNITVKEVAFLAVETVFLDVDTIDIFRGVSMFVAAPKWEVIGQRRIVISGQPGPEISEDKTYVANGKDGRPGLPGGNGGSFFGIGLQFSNGKSLRIESNGGRGGPGAKGAKGQRGLNGRNASENLKLGTYSSSYYIDKGVSTRNFEDTFSAVTDDTYMRLGYSRSYGDINAEVQLITENGECGKNGESGGLGGEAGVGGLPGDQQLIELGESSQIEMQYQNGSKGTPGRRGDPGDRGSDGSGMICVQVKNDHQSSYWKCISTNTTSSSCNICQKLDETDELNSQYTKTGIQQPATKNSPDFSYYLLDYTVLLESHTNNTIFNKIITDFREAIQRKFSYTLNDLGLLFFKGDIQRKSQTI